MQVADELPPAREYPSLVGFHDTSGWLDVLAPNAHFETKCSSMRTCDNHDKEDTQTDESQHGRGHESSDATRDRGALEPGTKRKRAAADSNGIDVSTNASATRRPSVDALLQEHVQHSKEVMRRKQPQYAKRAEWAMRFMQKVEHMQSDAIQNDHK